MKIIDGWISITVEQSCEILDSKRIPINSEEREKRIGDIPYYGANGLQGYIDDFIFNEPLILIAEDGGRFDEYESRPIAYRIRGKSWVNNHAHVLRAKSEYNQDLIFYNLEHKDIQAFIVGGTRSKLNQSSLRPITLYIPVFKSEQTKIAEVISTVDKAIEQTEALIAKQQRIKTGLIQDLFTSGIDKNGNLRAEHTHKFKNSQLSRIPVEWEVLNLSQFADVIDPQPDHRTPPVVSNGTAYIGISDFKKDGSIDFDRARKVSYAVLKKQQKSFRVDDIDFIFGKIGTIGAPRRLPTFKKYALSANIILIKPTETPSFIFWWVSSPFVERIVENEIHSTSQPAFGIKKMRDLKVLRPSEEERNKIGEILDSMELVNRTNQRELHKLKSIKTALMQDLLTGKKRVTTLLDEME